MAIRGPYNTERDKDDPTPSGFGERVRQVRLEWGWTQGELAQALGTDPATISVWENRKGKPSGVALSALAMLFRTTPEALATGDGFLLPPPPPARDPASLEGDLRVTLARDEGARLQVLDLNVGEPKPLETEAGMMALLQAVRAHRRVWIVLE